MRNRVIGVFLLVLIAGLIASPTAAQKYPTISSLIRSSGFKGRSSRSRIRPSEVTCSSTTTRRSTSES
jgi:hypothetical protein